MTLSCLSRYPGAMDIDRANRIFPTSNEHGREKVYRQLEKCPIFGDTLVGVSCLENLNFVAFSHVKLRKIVIIDVSRSVMHFWERVITILSESERREEAIEKICILFDAHLDRYFAHGSEGVTPPMLAYFAKMRLLRDIDRGLSFLSSDEGFNKIKEFLEQKDVESPIELKLGSITDQSVIFDTFKSLFNRSHHIGIIYISSVRDHLNREAWHGMMSNLSFLANARTLIIEANRSHPDGKLIQSMFYKGKGRHLFKKLPCLDVSKEEPSLTKENLLTLNLTLLGERASQATV